MPEINADVSQTWEARRERAKHEALAFGDDEVKRKLVAEQAKLDAVSPARRVRILRDLEREAELERAEYAARRQDKMRDTMAVTNQIKPGATIGHGVENRFTESVLDLLPPHVERRVRDWMAGNY